MNAIPNRAQFLRTIEAIDARQRLADFDAAVAEREAEADRKREAAWAEADRIQNARYDILVAEVRLFNHVFDVPAYGACLRGDA